MNLSETGNANICCTTSKGQMCFYNMKVPRGVICHFVTQKMRKTNISCFTVFYAEENIFNHEIREASVGKRPKNEDKL